MSSTAMVRGVRAAHKLSRGVDLDANGLRALLKLIPSRGSDLLPHGVKTRAEELEGIVTREAMFQLGLAQMIEAIQRQGPTSVLAKVSPANLEYFQALLDRYGEIPSPRIRLTSIHGAKGREADLVVLLGDMTRATFAEYQDQQHGGTEAENRVAYVGVTRASEVIRAVPASLAGAAAAAVAP
jgi:superfamily I DNA/RNA helicase